MNTMTKTLLMPTVCSLLFLTPLTIALAENSSFKTTNATNCVVPAEAGGKTPPHLDSSFEKPITVCTGKYGTKMKAGRQLSTGETCSSCPYATRQAPNKPVVVIWSAGGDTTSPCSWAQGNPPTYPAHALSGPFFAVTQQKGGGSSTVMAVDITILNKYKAIELCGLSVN